LSRSTLRRRVRKLPSLKESEQALCLCALR
jgi:hypothetical protein